MQKETTPAELASVKRIAKLMDEAIRIPGTNIRFGLDALLGLIPGAGDSASVVVSGTLVLAMIRHGVSGAVLTQMLGNILLDYVVGLVPVLGDIIDVGFKANTKNVKLLEKHYAERKGGKPSALKAFGQVVIVLAVIAFLVAGLIGLGIFLIA
ncbi:MAG: DUF4112 domain-containing protein [Bacteroidota bacterium]